MYYLNITKAKTFKTVENLTARYYNCARHKCIYYDYFQKQTAAFDS